MLKLTSRFVLLMALALVILRVADSLIGAALPAAASSPPRKIEMMIEPFGHGETTLDLIHQDHEVFAPNRFLREITKAAEADLEDR